jgi:hypothetical protein
MSVDTAAGYPQLENQGVIPTLYADEVNITYYDECLLPRITNSKFTGKVKDQGSKVIIAQRPVIVTKTYTKGMNLETQVPEADDIELTVNRAKYYRFCIDNIDAKQSHLVLSNEYVSDGVERMKIDTETDFWADIYADAHADNMGATAGAKSGAYNLGAAGSPLGLTKDNVVESLLTSVRAVLGEQNAARAGMWVVVPEWCRWLLMNSDLKNASIMGDVKSVQRTGRLLEVDGLTIYTSNLLKTTTADQSTGTYIMAGNKDSISFVAQMTKSRAFEAQNTFGMIYDGLHVYDWKVVKPEGLVSIYAYKQ